MVRERAELVQRCGGAAVRWCDGAMCVADVRSFGFALEMPFYRKMALAPAISRATLAHSRLTQLLRTPLKQHILTFTFYLL